MVVGSQYSLTKVIALILLCILLIWSSISPEDRLIWWLEALPTLVAWLLIGLVHRKFPLTDISFSLIWVSCVLMLIGAHYTYAEVPAFNWLRDTFDLSRNHFDRIGHFAQGFTLAMIVRELLLRTSPLKPGRWLFGIICFGILGLSATYELIEWIAAIILEEEAGDFLGMQGDVWDTQKDMALALLGAILAQFSLGKRHDKQIATIKLS